MTSTIDRSPIATIDIDPQNRQVEIYRLNKDTEVLRLLTQLSGEDILPGFVLDSLAIW